MYSPTMAWCDASGGRSTDRSLESTELRGQVEAIFEATFGGGECHDGGGIWLERQSYIEILQDIDGATLEEAHAILQDYPEDSWLRVKDFLDILFTSEVQKAEESMQERNQPGASTALEVHKIETSVTEGSDVQKPSTSEAHLRTYFLKDYKNGGVFHHDEYYFEDDHCWVHEWLGIKVWRDALDLTQTGGDGDVECYFHYTTELGFRNITHASKAAVEVFASLITSGEKANAWWGKGVYCVRKPPDEWPSVETLLDNNYRNMLKRDIGLKGHDAAIQDYRSRVEFCIPILVNASVAYDVSERPTPEMVEQAGLNLAGKLLNEAGMPPRECIVVRAQGEGVISNARAVLVETLRCRAEAAVTRRGLVDEYALSALHRLGQVLRNRGELAEAEAVWRRVLEAREAKWGAKDEETLVTFNNLAAVLYHQGKYEEAEPLYRRALEGSVVPEVFTQLNNLAFLLHEQGKYEESEALCRRALEGREAYFGARHPLTLMSTTNLGALLCDQGKLDESEVLLHRAVEGEEAQQGSHHPETLRSVFRLARLRVAQGRLEEGEVHFRRAMEGFETQLGVRHQWTLDAISGLAKLLEAKGSEEAHKLYQRQLDALKELHGPDHAQTCECRERLEHLRGNKRQEDPTAEAMMPDSADQ
ncbi:unnamed protein product [Durusdinium trenchii]|uniref:Kinesin light chain n=2 Tax=Durusdinium trenchii TaxID=1381693 RepID=A0ABP0MQM6_9DINO